MTLELWGGLEGSHVVVHNTLRDELALTGHLRRGGADIDRIAALGLRTMRVPVLWGAVDDGGRLDFAAADERLGRMRALGMRPIVGLLHHGTGPAGLHPTRAGFVAAFAAYAEAVAVRYPWVVDYTPINEPITSARFQFLYGLWQPHRRGEPAFLKAAFVSAVATKEAMRCIRRQRPDARLMQSEDCGRTFATPALAYQAAYENDRRFLVLDLLTGRVGADHPFRPRFEAAGVSPRELDAMTAEPCPPDLVGIDYYLTSDRWLDDRIARYPGRRAGGNGRHRYVDVEATTIDALKDECGFLPRLREVHARYGLPVALTEVHNGLTREEQLRWLMEAWRDAHAAQIEGIHVRAVTVWSLLGSTDWASLLTRPDGIYESGAFDTRSDPPRQTAIAEAIVSITSTGMFAHPVLSHPGWWRRSSPEADPSFGAMLFVVAAPHHLAALRARADVRGLPLATSANAAALGKVVVEGEPARFRLDRPGGPPLTVAGDGAFDDLADAFLDLAIDGETGHLTLTDVGARGQYVLRGAVAASEEPDALLV